MARARVYVPGVALVVGELSLAASHRYLTRSLRCRPGDPIVLFDGVGAVASASIVSITANDVRVRVDNVETTPPPAGPQVTSLVPLIKGERMDWCIQKLGELGVRRIVPVTTHHTVVKISGSRATSKVERWQQIAVAAATQSRQAYVAEVDAIISLDDALEQYRGDAMWVFDEAGTSDPQPPALEPTSVVLLTGPEGGLARDEISAALEVGYVRTHLGERILRAETAALIAAALVGFVFGDMGRAIALPKDKAV